MKLKNAIDTAVSHNALVVLEETDPKDSHYSVSIYEGMAHEIPNELLEREMFPITDVVGDPVGRLHIQLKTDFEADTPEKVVELAYNWCVENRLISIN